KVLGDLQHGCLGSRVDGPASRAEFAAGAAQVHHHATFRHVFGCFLREDCGGNQIDVEGSVPLLTTRSETLVVVAAGIIHQDIDAAVLLQRVLDATVDGSVVGDVGFAVLGAFADLGGHCLAR